MKTLLRQKDHRVLFFLAIAIALILTLVSLAPDHRLQVSLFVTNLQGVNTVKHLMAASGVETSTHADESAPDHSASYPASAAVLQNFRSTPLQKLELLDAQSRCWAAARPALAAGWRADALWESGRDEETCKLLTDLKAANKALAYARQSIEAGTWQRGTVYLRCVGNIAKLGVWVSPWWVAEVYQHLGQHYDDNGEVDNAIAAYGEASNWLPSVWSVPYVRKAQLLWGQKKTDEAIDWIVAGIPRCTDATSVFYLWLELGEMMTAQGADANGLCTYQKARDVMDQVPSQNLPDSLRQQTQEKLSALVNQVGAATVTCFEEYPGLLTR